MAHLLVGLDGSPHSRAALRWAERLATAIGGEIHLAHDWQHGPRLLGRPDASSATDVAGVESDIADAVRALAATTMDRPELATEVIVLGGDTGPSLVAEARRSGAGLIVVGTTGSGNARKLLLGSVSRRLTEAPTAAVAVVPDRPDPAPGRWTLVVGVDGSDAAARAVRWAGEVAAAAQGRVVVVHAVSGDGVEVAADERDRLLDERRQRVVQEWCAPLVAGDVEHGVEVAWGDARDVIARVAAAQGAACVVLGSRGLGAVSQRLLGSVTLDLLRRAEWPVVVIPAPRERPVWP